MTEEKSLTKEQVWNVLEFATSFYNDIKGLYGGGLYTPDILTQNLKNLNNSPAQPTMNKVERTLATAIDSVEELRAFCQYMEYFDTIFNKVVEYKANILTFDLSYVCNNAYGEDFKSKEYLEDRRRVEKFLFNFDYQGIFRDVVKNLLRNGVYYCWYRESTKAKSGNCKYALQMLPQSFCQTTGYTNMGLLFDVDLSFLLSGTVDLGLYAPIFGKYYSEIFETDNMNNYIPSNPLNKRDGSWSYIVQTSPDEGAWGFSYDTSTYTHVPPLASFMKDTLLNDEIKKLQYDKDMISAYGILVGEIQLKNDAKKQDEFAMNPKTLGLLLQMVARGLQSNIKVGAMPTKDNDFFQFEDKNPDMYSDQVITTAGIGASASRIIYSSDKASEAELIAQITTDATPLKKLYIQFAQFLNFFVNRKTKKYKWTFWFDGIDYWFDKEERREALQFSIDRGIVPNATMFAQALGYPPHFFEHAIDEGKNGDLADKLGQLISIHTASGSESLNDKGGRPRKRRVATSSRDYDKRKTGKRT